LAVLGRFSIVPPKSASQSGAIPEKIIYGHALKFGKAAPIFRATMAYSGNNQTFRLLSSTNHGTYRNSLCCLCL
jgi:hypothetical protein